jgi:Rne/Rng family ribonuclease
MRKELIISTVPQETRVALLEDDELVEFMIERHRAQGIVGNIYKGRVTKVLPGMQSAFVDIGLDRDAFLYVSDFVEDGDEYDRIVSSAEDEALKEAPSDSRSAAGRGGRSRPARRRGVERAESRAPASGEAEPAARPEDSAPESSSAAGARPKAGARTEGAGARTEEGDETRFGAGDSERPGGERRTERRVRRGRIPSFEPREEAPRSGGLQVLPGETLAKYGARPSVPAEEEAVGDQTPEASASDVGEDVEEDSTKSPASAEDDSPAETAERGDSDGDEDETERREARISDPPASAQFSRKPPARRSRRRHSPKGDSRTGDGSSTEPQISDLLRAGQEILVQVSKEPLGKKGARITSHIALPGRYLVYMPTVDHVGVSRKISTDEERSRLRQVINENREGLPGGFIVRTAAEGREEAEFIQDIRFLGDLWKEIRERSEAASAPAIMHSDLGLVERVLRDQLTDEFRAIRLDSEAEYTRVLEFVSKFQPSMVNRVRLHLRDTPIFEEYGLQQEVDKAMKSKVWLKSGGYIVVNQTEALVAIDVNTGKFVGKSNRLEDTIVRTNLDAVHEIVRQIRLRNLGGIIVVDFIDMEERKNRQKVMQALEEELRRDKSPSKILQFNDFGLVAITRKRTQPSLERVLGRPCPRCGGAGFVKAVETVCYEIQQEVGKMLAQIEGPELTVRVNPEVAKAIKSGEFVDFSELEEATRKDLRIQADPTLDAERFDIY